MDKELLHIWGPFSIQSYGFFMVLGIAMATWLFMRNPKRKTILSSDQFSKIITFTIFVAIIGGRLLYIFEDNSTIKNFWDIFKIWEGGLSSLGSLISILLCVPAYLKYLKIPVINFLDLASIYAPIVESCARLGCFFAGCCYGIETTAPWAVVYTNQGAGAPLYKAIHPTQLYSSFAALLAFIIMRFIFWKKLQKPGQLITAYLMLTSIARFSIDFLRGDRTFFTNTGVLSFLSTSQWISLLITLFSFTTLLLIQKFTKNSTPK